MTFRYKSLEDACANSGGKPHEKFRRSDMKKVDPALEQIRHTTTNDARRANGSPPKNAISTGPVKAEATPRVQEIHMHGGLKLELSQKGVWADAPLITAIRITRPERESLYWHVSNRLRDLNCLLKVYSHSNGKRITELLSPRDELITIPEGANWLAMDADGRWCTYEKEPCMYGLLWGGGPYTVLFEAPQRDDWCDTLIPLTAEAMEEVE